MVQLYMKIVNNQSVTWYGKTNKEFISLYLHSLSTYKQFSKN
jgi:hypothetical protein